MKRLVALTLVLGLFLGSAPAAQAGYPNPGTGKTDIYLQNVGAGDCALNVTYTTAVGGTGPSSATYQDPSVVPQWTTRVIPSSVSTDPALPTPWAGAAEVSATEPMAGAVAVLWDGASKTAGIYKGLGEGSTRWYIPYIVVADTSTSQAKTAVTIHNVETVPVTVTLRLYDGSGTLRRTLNLYNIPAKTERSVDLSQSAYRPDFSSTGGIGTGHVTASSNIGVVVTLHWGVSENNSSDCYMADMNGAPSLYFPAVFRQSSRFSEVYITNLGSRDAHVDIYFRKADGYWTSFRLLNQVIKPREVKVLKTVELTGLGSSFSGQLEVFPTSGYGKPSLTGVCKVTQTTGARDVAVYNRVRSHEFTGDAGMAFPLAVRKMSGSTPVMHSVTYVRNISAWPGSVTVEFFGATSSTPVLTRTLSIPKRGQIEIDLSSVSHASLGNDFTGSMRITSDLVILGATLVYWDSAGRAAAYTHFPIPIQ